MLIKDPPIQIADSLFMLGTNEFPLFLAKGPDEAALFEGGVSALQSILPKQLDRLHIKTDFVRQVIITHAHADHVMALPFLRGLFPNLIVCASKEAAAALSSQKTIASFAKADRAVNASLARAAAGKTDTPEPRSENQIAVDRIIGEGDTVTVDHLSFQVLRTPGHSKCSLSFYEPDPDCLIISDATGYYVPQQNYWWPNYFTGYEAYLASIKRLASLKTECLCLGHNAVIKGAGAVKAYFEGAMAATENYHKRILADCGAGTPPRQIAEKLGAEAFEKIGLFKPQFFRKNCSILVKLSLKFEGIKPKEASELK